MPRTRLWGSSPAFPLLFSASSGRAADSVKVPVPDMLEQRLLSCNPRPFGMPPFAYTLNDEEVAAVVTYMRQSCGNRAAAVAPADVAPMGQRRHAVDHLRDAARVQPRGDQRKLRAGRGIRVSAAIVEYRDGTVIDVVRAVG